MESVVILEVDKSALTSGVVERGRLGVVERGISNPVFGVNDIEADTV